MLLKKRFLFSAVLALLVFVGQAAAGSNANAVVSLDLIVDGGAGNQADDGVTSGTVSGQGTKIAVEVFATGVTTPLEAIWVEFDFDPDILTFDKAGNSAFDHVVPAGTAVLLPVEALPASGFLIRAEFTTAVDVTDREFSIGIAGVGLFESDTSSDGITTTKMITFNADATPSPDFDGDGEVGISDFLLFVDVFGSSRGDGKYEAKYDLDSNGVIGIPDFLTFVDNFGKTVPSSGGDGGEQIVDIPDANLRAVIADSLGKASDATITRADMLTLTHLDAPNTNISDLTGLAYATNLQTLDLGDEWVYGRGRANSNSVSDFSPLSSLTSLTLLDLGRNDILDISALVSAISGLTNLRSLSLDGNNISDFSPLSSLTSLTLLDLEDNDISDISALVSAISGLTNLRSLSLGNNNISDISPLSSLTNLTELRLLYNTISDISPLSGLTNLTELSLRRTSISDISPLSGLTNLTELNLGLNNISDISPLSGLTSLEEYLDLSRNDISDISPLSSLINLKRLYLDENRISDISALSDLTNLTGLVLHDNSISDISPLVANTGLGSGGRVYLDLQNNPLSNTSLNTHIPMLQDRGVTVRFDPTPPPVDVDPTPVSIPDANLRAAIETALRKAIGATITRGDMSTLKRLDAQNKEIRDLTGLEYATNLTELDLSGTSISDLSALVSAISGLTNLTELNLSDNSILDLSALSNLTNLTRLYLSDNSISDLSALSNLTNLTWLSLSGNGISDLSALSGLTNLIRLYLPRNSISDLSALSNLTNLTWLSLSGNGISDLSALSNLTNLTRLYLSDNSISDLAPLVSNTGLGSEDGVHVQNNPLSNTSINTHIPALQGRGVTVLFGSSKPAVGETERRMPPAAMKRFGRAEWEKDGDSFEQ